MEKNLRSIKKGKGKFAADSSGTSSDSDSPKPKTKVKTDTGKDITEIKSYLTTLFTVQKTMKLPIAVRRVVQDSFRCAICQDTISPPAIFSRCCRFIIGCEGCIDRWYEDRSKSCPRCRQERGFSETCRLNGLDEFLQAVKDLLSNETE
ncbi:hypothetical protein SPONN_2366 [uncultured Candidatus Thioglobus sp.]|nr:hypothetical protein SPONN_2366 [uncultured Candidatus Thioglobus sp.]